MDARRGGLVKRVGVFVEGASRWVWFWWRGGGGFEGVVAPGSAAAAITRGPW